MAYGTELVDPMALGAGQSSRRKSLPPPARVTPRRHAELDTLAIYDRRENDFVNRAGDDFL